MSKKVLILGANGFIGSDLSAALLEQTDVEIFAFDLDSHKLNDVIDHSRFHFTQGDMLKEKTWIDEHIKKCDVILPLVAIATPATYVSDPLRVFELDFEANLEIIHRIVTHKKRVIFPSTSEVYGMCEDKAFDEETSNFVLGPTQKERWIYSCSKQLLDRVIYAYGQHKQLDFTLFRPFNWIGPKQDDPLGKNPRVLTQFIGNIMRGEDITLVSGGEQRRTFIYIEDGINCLVKIIENNDNKASGRIFNIGNPENDHSIKELAELVLKYAKTHERYRAHAEKTKLVSVHADEHYGKSYQDVEARVPSIQRAKDYLGWSPVISMEEAVKRTVAYHLGQ
ncbi:MAG: NAD-dependent epimerase/dehydratase family protein [Legionellaceae bacterium]|nr:NAD-dependent epimerase/dehydratase family protein [Legionellaceae bacterium]